jgi:hypothetical protein
VKRIQRELGDNGSHAFRRTNRHSRLRDNDDFSRDAATDCLGDGKNMPEIAEPSSSGGVPDRNEDDLCATDRSCDVGRELESLLRLISLDEFLESRLVNWNRVLAKRLNLRRVDIRTRHVVACLRETCPDDEPDIPSTNHCNAH